MAGGQSALGEKVCWLSGARRRSSWGHRSAQGHRLSGKDDLEAKSMERRNGSIRFHEWPESRETPLFGKWKGLSQEIRGMMRSEGKTSIEKGHEASSCSESHPSGATFTFWVHPPDYNP